MERKTKRERKIGWRGKRRWKGIKKVKRKKRKKKKKKKRTKTADTVRKKMER